MIYKNKDLKNKYKNKNLIFIAIIVIYVTGVFAGCGFVFKNADNLTFVKKVIIIENILKIEINTISALSVKYMARNILCICCMIILKYSGVLKGMCVCVPFIVAVQNSAIYSITLYEKRASVFQLIYNHILKDSATIFIILIYCCVIIYEILNHKEDVKNDIKKRAVYITSVCLIQLIDYTVKTMISAL